MDAREFNSANSALDTPGVENRADAADAAGAADVTGIIVITEPRWAGNVCNCFCPLRISLPSCCRLSISACRFASLCALNTPFANFTP